MSVWNVGCYHDSRDTRQMAAPDQPPVPPLDMGDGG